MSEAKTRPSAGLLEIRKSALSVHSHSKASPLQDLGQRCNNNISWTAFKYYNSYLLLVFPPVRFAFSVQHRGARAAAPARHGRAVRVPVRRISMLWAVAAEGRWPVGVPTDGAGAKLTRHRQADRKVAFHSSRSAAHDSSRTRRQHAVEHN